MPEILFDRDVVPLGVGDNDELANSKVVSVVVAVAEQLRLAVKERLCDVDSDCVCVPVIDREGEGDADI